MSPASDASVRLQRTWLVLIGVSLALALFGAVLVQWRQVELLDDAVHGQTDALGWHLPDKDGYAASAQNLIKRGYLL